MLQFAFPSGRDRRTASALAVFLVAAVTLEPILAQSAYPLAGSDTLVSAGERYTYRLVAPELPTISSGQFGLSWPAQQLRIIDARIPADTFGTESPFTYTTRDSTFRLIYSYAGAGEGQTFSAGSVWAEIEFETLGQPGSEACVVREPGFPIEFISGLDEELDVGVEAGCVSLRESSSLATREQTKLLYSWLAPGQLYVSFPASHTGGRAELFSLSGRRLTANRIPPGSTDAVLSFTPLLNPSVAVLRYTMPSYQEALLVTRPR